MLKILPGLDSDEMAATRRKELDIPQHKAASLGRSAVEAPARGFYITGNGMKVDWKRYVQAACSAKVSIPPNATLPARETIPFLKLEFKSPTRPLWVHHIGSLKAD